MSELGLCLAWAMHRHGPGALVLVLTPYALGQPELCAFLGVHLCCCLCDNRCRDFGHTLLSCACAPTYLSGSVCMLVCLYVQMPAYTCTCVSVCLNVNPTCISMHACVYACVCAQLSRSVKTRLCVHSCLCLVCTRPCMSVCEHLCPHQYACLCAFLNTCLL